MERAQSTKNAIKTEEELIKKLKEFLGDIGIDYFRNIKKKYGKINAVWMDGKVPHVVHFREGMQVRNFLRIYLELDAVELDGIWVDYVEKAIGETE